MEALQKVVSRLPADLPAAVFVVWDRCSRNEDDPAVRAE